MQKAISILYKGENSIEIKKVKANKGNCDVYEYNYGYFKDNRILSRKTISQNYVILMY